MENTLLKDKVELCLTSLQKEIKEHIKFKGPTHYLSFHGNLESIYSFEQYKCNLVYVDKMNGERRLGSLYVNHCLDIWENPKTFRTNIKEIKTMLEDYGCPSVGSKYMGRNFATCDTTGWCYRVTLGVNNEGFVCGEREHFNRCGTRVHCETIIFLDAEIANKWYKELIKETNPLGLKSFKIVSPDGWHKRVEKSHAIGKDYRSQMFLTLDRLKNMRKSSIFKNDTRSIEKIWVNESKKYGWKVSLLAKKYKNFNEIFVEPEMALLAYNQGKFSKNKKKKS